jgi:hypothetical protein
MVSKQLNGAVMCSILNNARVMLTGCCFRDDDELDALPQILAYSYKLHNCNQTAQAVKLYNLINILLNSGWGRKPILLFLANLAGEVQDNSMKVSHISFFILVYLTLWKWIG